MSTYINQTYLEWYEFDGNVVRILIATCTYQSINVVVSMNESEFIVKFQYYSLTYEYNQNVMSAYM